MSRMACRRLLTTTVWYCTRATYVLQLAGAIINFTVVDAWLKARRRGSRPPVPRARRRRRHALSSSIRSRRWTAWTWARARGSSRWGPASWGWSERRSAARWGRPSGRWPGEEWAPRLAEGLLVEEVWPEAERWAVTGVGWLERAVASPGETAAGWREPEEAETAATGAALWERAEEWSAATEAAWWEQEEAWSGPGAPEGALSGPVVPGEA
ncbi:hypothetical protein GUJ93_ZPchr0006g45547 [Zizania palustris]|uniref:Uncharacterized protein n=1 Tax=Zizania palustris TaxID=103762 RepID=A0A8J5SBA2_ZIZPA|nr:hypothetical protein GUJ93_ZPchr0006g45547 [Zizania palustris]